MPNGECPVGAENRANIRNLARSLDALRNGQEELREGLEMMRIDDAVTSTRTKLLLLGLPGVGGILGGIITALVMRALGT